MLARGHVLDKYMEVTEQFQELTSLLPPEGTRARTQVLRLGRKHLHFLSHRASPARWVPHPAGPIYFVLQPDRFPPESRQIN